MSPEEIHAYPSTITKHPAYDPAYDELIDCREADGSALSTDVLRRMVAINRDELDEAPHRIAYVVDGDFGFALVRQYTTFGDRHTRSQHRLFREMAEALAWLGLPADLDET